MATYTIVDRDFGVVVCKNLDLLCDEIRGAAYEGQPLFICASSLGPADAQAATIKAVKNSLRFSGDSVRYIYRGNGQQWFLKIQRHRDNKGRAL